LHFGEAHLLTARSLNNLAALYEKQGRYTEAERLYLQALAIVRQQMGESDPMTALCLNNLGALYKA
jgi:Flp pilus assembly protein TadD